MTLAPGATKGIARSLRLYHGDPARAARMDALYGRFLRTGDLAIDIGAHVGDRVSCFRRLGARVVAVEPQPAAMRALRLIHERDPQVTLLAAAVGAEEGELTLSVNSANPTVTTASPAFVEASRIAPAWQGQVWDASLTVPSVTLDSLIADHGQPAFVKIDVEGFEPEVLRGLSSPLPALSFEITTHQRDVALSALDRVESLAPRRYAISLGETQVLSDWMDRSAMARHLRDLPDEANSGDVYAVEP